MKMRKENIKKDKSQKENQETNKRQENLNYLK